MYSETSVSGVYWEESEKCSEITASTSVPWHTQEVSSFSIS